MLPSLLDRLPPSRLAAAALALAGCGGPAPPAVPPVRPVIERVLVDTHVDLPYRLAEGGGDPIAGPATGDFDLPRARRGGLDAVFLAIYTPSDQDGTPASRATAEKRLDEVEDLVARSAGEVVLVGTPAGLRAAAAAGKLAFALGMENAAPVGDDLAALARFHERGIRYVGLTHGRDNQLADSSYTPPGERRWRGLSPLGREAVAEMNRLGMMVDLSHLSDDAVDQVLALSRAPVIASHSSCRHFTPGFERNLDDERIRRVAARGGVVQINFGSAFLTAAANRHGEAEWRAVEEFVRERGLAWSDPSVAAFRDRRREEHPFPRATLADVVAHVDHVVALAGVDHVGFGSDFEGVGDTLPAGLGDVAAYPNLLAALGARGYSEADVAKIAGGNLLRVWEEVERVGEELQAMSAEARHAPALVRLATGLGAIDVEVEIWRAPRTAAQFLRAVESGRYDSGRFHRTVRPDNETRREVPIEVVQAGLAPEREGDDLPPVALERTRDTGLAHRDGAISLARDTPDSATTDFFLCLGDQPALDFGGARNPDGQGFAAFGRVVAGREVVRAIQAASAEGQRLVPPISLLSARRVR